MLLYNYRDETTLYDVGYRLDMIIMFHVICNIIKNNMKELYYTN